MNKIQSLLFRDSQSLVLLLHSGVKMWIYRTPITKLIASMMKQLLSLLLTYFIIKEFMRTISNCIYYMIYAYRRRRYLCLR